MGFIIVGRCKGCGNPGAGNLVTPSMTGGDLAEFLGEMVASDYAISVENTRSLVLRQCRCHPVGDSFTDPHAEQLTLGDFIRALDNLPNVAVVRCYSGESVSSLCSYRGYYDQLAIGRSAVVKTVADVLKNAKHALGESFDGYKGGSYRMDNSTPVWFADYGEAPGYAVVGVRHVGDAVHILTRKVEQSPPRGRLPPCAAATCAALVRQMWAPSRTTRRRTEPCRRVRRSAAPGGRTTRPLSVSLRAWATHSLQVSTGLSRARTTRYWTTRGMPSSFSWRSTTSVPSPPKWRTDARLRVVPRPLQSAPVPAML